MIVEKYLALRNFKPYLRKSQTLLSFFSQNNPRFSYTVRVQHRRRSFSSNGLRGVTQITC